MTSTGVGNYSDLPSSTINYGYNSVGEKVSMSSPVGNFTYGRDAAGRLRSIASSNSGSFNFGYDLAQRLTQIQSPAMTTSFEFDSTGFNTKINYVRGSGATVERFIYGRDHVGNRVSKTTTRGLSQYAYDQNYQLIQAVTPELPAETFSYDSIGNRTSDSDGLYVYDNSKQLIQQDHKYNYVFDLNGNLISKQERNLTGNVQNYEYSSENQLRAFKLYENGNLVKDVTYAYDALGRRVEKQVVDHSDSSKSFTRRFIYDGNEVLAEYDHSNDLINTYTHSTLRTDDVLAVTNDSGTFYFVKDALGSITDITNSSGQIVQHHEYSSFGVLKKVTDATGVDISANPVIDPYFTYTGREYDKESGIYHYRARVYDPNVGRFLQTDPDAGRLSTPTTLNTKYSYVLNNPMNLIDPFGTSVFGNLGASVGNLGSNIGKFYKNNKELIDKTAITVAIVGAAAVTGGAALGIASVGGGFATGFAAGVSGVLTTAAISGAVGAGIAALTGSNATQVYKSFLGGAASGAVVAAASMVGLAFGGVGTTSGALASGLTGAVSGGLFAADINSQLAYNRDASDQEITAFAVAGGIGGLLSGALIGSPGSGAASGVNDANRAATTGFMDSGNNYVPSR